MIEILRSELYFEDPKLLKPGMELTGNQRSGIHIEELRLLK
jgi:hypothetical protein